MRTTIEQLNMAKLIHKEMQYLKQFQMVPSMKKALAAATAKWHKLPLAVRDAVDRQIPIPFPKEK